MQSHFSERLDHKIFPFFMTPLGPFRSLFVQYSLLSCDDSITIHPRFGLEFLKCATWKVFCLFAYPKMQPDLWVGLDQSLFVEMYQLLLMMWLDCLPGFVLSYKQSRMKNFIVVIQLNYYPFSEWNKFCTEGMWLLQSILQQLRYHCGPVQKSHFLNNNT